ncbi:epithelial splicing regulatory protein 1-like [Actinia tenebrosa]|uniref:Epithelial splicing regulatory protein 1-like n=1 Tax=Actinia tenebrosa TaxID=6105 RepID=A0A6P8IEB7_ACTTE|nr:epithelial splicing regulatory protein 1-like [Actinia tenebrosa]
MSVVIKMKGLPFESTAKDIKSFFQGLYLREDEIHLAAYKDGKAAGIAFAVFHSDEDARKAMFRNGKYIGKRYIELFLSSTSEMNSMLQQGVPKPRQAREGGGQREEMKSKGNRGKMKQNRVQNVKRSDRSEVHPRARSRSPISRQGNPGRESNSRSFGGSNRGPGFGGDNERHVELDDREARFFEMRMREEEDERQDRYHRLHNEREIPRERMGNKSFQMDKRDMHREKGNGREDANNRNKQRGSPQSSREERDRGDRNDETCCRLFGLPFQVSESEVRNFFKGFSVLKIKLLYHPEGSFAGRKNGQAYVEFRSVQESREAAKKKHKQYMGNRYVEVTCCSKREMIEESKVNDDLCQRAQEGQRGDRESRFSSVAGNHPISDLAIKIDPEILNSAYSMPNFLDSNPDLRNLGFSLPNPYMSSEAVDLQTLATLRQLESRANINPDDVTAGCVVGIRNLPSTITAEEILDFFYGFPVFSDSVRIHYLAPGQSSGDAMVTFRSSREATAAIEQLNHKPVGKRNVQLFLV